MLIKGKINFCEGPEQRLFINEVRLLPSKVYMGGKTPQIWTTLWINTEVHTH